MKYSVVVNVLIGIVWMVVAGCGTSESNTPQETRVAEETIQPGDQKSVEPTQVPLEGNIDEYVKGVKSKWDQLNDKHTELVDQVQQAGSETANQVVLGKTLDDLTKKREEVQRQIEALKAAKGEDWLALQPDMNRALEELTQSYDKALAMFVG